MTGNLRAAPLLFVVALGCAVAPRPGWPPGPEPHPIRFSLLAVGDTGKPPRWGHPFHAQHAVGLALAAEDRRHPADALLLLGDNFYSHGLRADELAQRVRINLVRPYCRFVELAGSRSGEVSGACGLPSEQRHPLPIFAVLGNHDYEHPASPALQKSELPRYVSNWYLPPGVAASVDFASGVSLILVDSEALRRGADPTPLCDALRRSRGPWRILAMHHPMAWARDREGDSQRRHEAYRAQLRQALERAGVPVHLVVSGDEHNLQLIEMPAPGPTLQVVSGGGSGARPLRTSNPDVRFALSALGFARIDLVESPGAERLMVSLFATSGVPALGGGSPRLAARFAVTRDGRLSDLLATSDRGAPMAGASADRLPAPTPPPASDHSAPTLRAYQEALLAHWGGDYRNVPLEAKARHFEWLLWRYHRAPSQQIQPRVFLPQDPTQPVVYDYGADVATWNGALLAALSYEYAVTGAPETLERIAGLVEGLHLFLEVTGQPGLPARYVRASQRPVGRATEVYPDPDGTTYHYRADPAKGTLNQLVLGYATLLMLVSPDLPEATRRRAGEDLAQLVMHLIRHDYRLTGLDGERTRYGSLRPRFGWIGVPFNAQLAYTIVAAAHTFPPQHPAQRQVIDREFHRLRTRHHVYFESPWKPPFFVHPQRVGKSRFLDANDLNHLVNAAYVGLSLELHDAKRAGRTPDRRFLYRLGRTLYWSVEKLEKQRNSLASFMWVALLQDGDAFDAMIPKHRDPVLATASGLLDAGVEQLRRFPLDRFRREGHIRRTKEPQWADAFRPDSYYWKVDANLAWETTGPPSDLLTAAIDYLHAYWLFRYHGLDHDPRIAQRHGAVLAGRAGADPLGG